MSLRACESYICVFSSHRICLLLCLWRVYTGSIRKTQWICMDFLSSFFPSSLLLLSFNCFLLFSRRVCLRLHRIHLCLCVCVCVSVCECISLPLPLSAVRQVHREESWLGVKVVFHLFNQSLVFTWINYWSHLWFETSLATQMPAHSALRWNKKMTKK